jgi:lipopolysaccharide/colanic/teichoic acid biosynthesis glycosyltransferase
MQDTIQSARREMFESLNIPMSRADMRRLRRRARLKIVVWELYLATLLLIKRAFDIIISLEAFIVFAPMYILTALAIVIEDWGPVFYTQTRVGQYGREFRFYKFRSMYVDADARKQELLDQNESGAGVIFKMRKDPRVTRVGRVIRKFSIDETPQFWNVLRGDLSLVGPRPPIPAEVREYTLRDRKRLNVKPGLTCLWQIKGRSDIPFDQQVELDIEYISQNGIWKDFVIMLKTIPAVLLGRGAY